MSAKKICIEKDQQISNDGDKDQKIVINSLDYDSLAQIFMLLPIPERINMEKVCTKWKEACQLAWYDIKKYESSIGHSYNNRILKKSFIKKILSRCGNYLNELSLSDVRNSRIMLFVGDHCKNLTTLECKFNDNPLIDNADHFIQAFTQLEKLKCIKITADYFCFDNRTFNLSAIIDSLPKEIDEIYLFAKSTWEPKQIISMSFKKFKSLQKLTILDFCLDNINFQEIADITTLVYLSIGLYDIHTNLSLFNKLVNLEYIDLTMGIDYDAKNLSTKVLEAIFCTCKNLKHLDIPSGTYDLAGISIGKWMNFQNLEYLGISCNIMPELADTIVEYCKNLKHLRIMSYNILDIAALKKLTESKNLECLIMNAMSYHGNFSLKEESIIAISNNCKKLKRLEIPGCIIVSSIDGEPLPSSSVFDELSKLQCLEHLNLSFIEKLEDSTIIAIANNCKNLKSLDIQGCTGITETGFDALTYLENLQKLYVSGIDIITDSFLIKLKGLKELHCKSCKKLTTAGIIQFIKNNPDLEQINLFGINNLTRDFFIAADQATKNRTNGIILHLTMV